MSAIDHLISKYSGIANWEDYYRSRGKRDDAPAHLAALATEQREVALQIINQLMTYHQISTVELERVGSE